MFVLYSKTCTCTQQTFITRNKINHRLNLLLNGNTRLSDCGALADPVHGTVTTPEGTTYGAKALYSCDGRYKLSGPQARTCYSTGNWWGTESSCEPIGKTVFYLVTTGSIK